MRRFVLVELIWLARSLQLGLPCFDGKPFAIEGGRESFADGIQQVEINRTVGKGEMIEKILYK